MVTSVGSLQFFAWQDADCESIIHAMHLIYEDETWMHQMHLIHLAEISSCIILPSYLLLSPYM